MPRLSLATLAAALVFAGACSDPVLRPTPPPEPSPSELRYTWRPPVSRSTFEYTLAAESPAAGGDVVFTALNPADEDFTCDMPDGSRELFSPRRYGVIVEVRNGSESIWKADGDEADVVMDVGGQTMPIMRNPARHILSLLVGLNGTDSLSQMAGAWMTSYQNVKQQQSAAYAAAASREAEARFDAERRRQNTVAEMVARGEPVPPELASPMQAKTEPPKLDNPESLGSTLEAAAVAVKSLLGNPGGLLLAGAVEKRFLEFGWQQDGATAGFEQYVGTVRGGYANLWQSYADDRRRRQLLIEDEVAPDALGARIEKQYAAQRAHLEAEGAARRKSAKDACQQKLALSLARYAEWPQRVLPGYTTRIYLPFMPAEAVAQAGAAKLALYGMPVKYDSAGEVSVRKNIVIGLTIKPVTW
jgi:hypothetical protein